MYPRGVPVQRPQEALSVEQALAVKPDVHRAAAEALGGAVAAGVSPG